MPDIVTWPPWASTVCMLEPPEAQALCRHVCSNNSGTRTHATQNDVHTGQRTAPVHKHECKATATSTKSVRPNCRHKKCDQMLPLPASAAHPSCKADAMQAQPQVRWESVTAGRVGAGSKRVTHRAQGGGTSHPQHPLQHGCAVSTKEQQLSLTATPSPAAKAAINHAASGSDRS